MWPFDLGTQESDWTGCGVIEEWREVCVSSRDWIHSFRENSSFPKGVRPDWIGGTVSYVQPELTDARRWSSKRLPPGINPYLELLSKTQLLMVIASPLILCSISGNCTHFSYKNKWEHWFSR